MYQQRYRRGTGLSTPRDAIGLRARVVGCGMSVMDLFLIGEWLFVPGLMFGALLADFLLHSAQCDTAPYCQCEH